MFYAVSTRAAMAHPLHTALVASAVQAAHLLRGALFMLALPLLALIGIVITLTHRINRLLRTALRSLDKL